MKINRNKGTFKIIMDIPNMIEPDKIFLVINGIELLFLNNKNIINKEEVSFRTCNNSLFNAIEKLPSGKYKSGDGRKAQQITDRYKVCLSTVYQAQKLLVDAPNEILQKVRRGEMQIKTAYKLVKEYEKKLLNNHSKKRKE